MTYLSYGVHWHNNDTLLCFIAGISLGVLVTTRMYIFGKVTGISGILSGLIEIKKNAPALSFNRLVRLMFIGGLVGGGGIASKYLPDCFEDWSTLPLGRLIPAGFLVGFGTVLGNGCTSGHGVCGISSMRSRSIIATCTFMLAAFITAMSADTSSFLPKFENELPVERSGGVVGVCILTCAVLAGLAKYLRDYHGESFDSNHTIVQIVTLLMEGIFGIVFALAMAVSNMAKLSATISFLDLRYWNPALAFIMGGSIMVAAVGFYVINMYHKNPMLDLKFYMPTLSVVDAKLILGATCFGVGWGLAGACPGPALTNVGSGNIPPLIYAACIFGGIWINNLVEPHINDHLTSLIFFNHPNKVTAPETTKVADAENQVAASST